MTAMDREADKEEEEGPAASASALALACLLACLGIYVNQVRQKKRMMKRNIIPI